ncbi:MAG: TonB-dependent receptor [Bacteroidales bacterium]|jgi:TonB-linked SusC/RagA family outer membrane protein
MKKLFLFFISQVIVIPVFSQQSIKGKVTDERNNPIPAVTVQVKNTTRGTFCDSDGGYVIVASTNDTLVFSMIGMATQQIPVAGRSVINVKLLEQSQELGEVVVIGYGTVKKSDLTGSVTSVKSIDLNKITTLNPEQGLQGKVTGVQVTSTSGAPGAIPTVRIRGVGTFNNSSPIFVVDGVIVDDISFLNSEDIASMDILKDASATAIYGSRGANGVILVTTKTGQKGQAKATFSYAGEYSMQVLAKKIDLLNGPEYGTVVNEILPTYNNVDLLPSTDWQSLIFHPASIQSHQLSASGATESTQYYVSVGYFNQNGIVDKSGYERITFKLNNTYFLTKNIKLGNFITITPYKQENAPNVTYSAYRAKPLLPAYNPDGTFAPVVNVGNPLADLAYSNNYNKGVRGVGNLYAEATILKNFVLKTSFGLDGAYNQSTSFTPAYYVSSQQQNLLNTLSKGDGHNITWLWENTLSYKQQFGVHSFDAVAGYTMQETSSENFSITGKNIIRTSPDFWYINPSYIYDPNNGVNTISTISNTVDPNQYYSMISYLFRINYTYNSKYLLTATFRRDGSSKFTAANRYGNFPSFAAGWIVSKERFMESLKFLSNLKVRASWGIIGNDKIPYDSQYSLTQSMVTILGIPPTANSANSYGVSGNPNLKWESTKQADAGLEISVFNNKLSGEFDYYNRVTDDILIPLATPDYLGNGQGATVNFNAASVKNTGFESKITWKDKIGEVYYNISVLGSTVRNEVLKVGGSSGIDSVLYGGFMANGLPVTQSRVGLPIGAFWGYKTDGVFQTQADINAYPHMASAVPGDLRFVDVNHDGKLDGNDRTYIGSPIPKFTLGLNLAVDYKGFDLSFDIQGVYGNKIFNAKEVVRPDPYNWEKHVLYSWTGPGTSNTEPRASYGGNNYLPSDKFVQDGSFTRLRNVTLGYTLPSAWTKKASISQLRVYVKGSNIFTLAKFTGYTPEIGSSDVLSNGIDFGTYPITSVYSFGVNLTF